MADWENLPQIPLIIISQFLSIRDRYNFEQVCDTWDRAVNHAGLWRKVHLTLSNVKEDYYETITLLEKHAPSIIEMNIIGLEWKQGISPVPSFWRSLREMPLQLTSLTLKNLCQTYRDFDIVEFVRSQSSLEELTLRKLNLSKSDVEKILLYLPTCLKKFNLVEVSQLRGATYIDLFSALSVHLGRLEDLRELSLEAALLSDSLLHAMPSSLRCFNVLVCRPDVEPPSDAAWLDLTMRCPLLKANYKYEPEAVHFSLRISSDAPLVALVISFPREQEAPVASMLLPDYLSDIITHHSTTIEVLEIHFKDNVENLDDQLVRLLQSCKKLRHFHFTGIIMNVDTIWTMLDIVNQNSQFNRCYMSPKFLNRKNHLSIVENSEEWKVALAGNNVRFKFDDSTADSGID